MKCWPHSPTSSSFPFVPSPCQPFPSHWTSLIPYTKHQRSQHIRSIQSPPPAPPPLPTLQLLQHITPIARPTTPPSLPYSTHSKLNCLHHPPTPSVLQSLQPDQSPPQAHALPPAPQHTALDNQLHPPSISTAQHSTAQQSTAQHSTAQHSTAQHSTAQHSTAQHSTAQHTHHVCLPDLTFLALLYIFLHTAGVTAEEQARAELCNGPLYMLFVHV